MQVQAPAPAAAPVIFNAQQVSTSPRAAYEALTQKREVLGDQMSRLLNRRDNISERLHSGTIAESERVALDQHMKELTTRIIDMEKQLHAADAEVSAAAGVPGATTALPRGSRGSDFGEAEAMGIAAGFFGMAVVIVAIAWARRVWKGAPSAALPSGFEARFSRMEETLDAVAIEIERVSEGQRFVNRVHAESARAVGAGSAQPVEVNVANAEHLRR